MKETPVTTEIHIVKIRVNTGWRSSNTYWCIAPIVRDVESSPDVSGKSGRQASSHPPFFTHVLQRSRVRRYFLSARQNTRVTCKEKYGTADKSLLPEVSANIREIRSIRSFVICELLPRWIYLKKKSQTSSEMSGIFIRYYLNRDRFSHHHVVN